MRTISYARSNMGRRNALGLTKRQMDVALLLVRGEPSKVIARRLGVSIGTVKSHTTLVYDAFDVYSRNGLYSALCRRIGVQPLYIAMLDYVDREEGNDRARRAIALDIGDPAVARAA